MPARFKDICLDAGDHQSLADWWCAAMGCVRLDVHAPPEDGWVRPDEWPVPIVDPSGVGPKLWLNPVPEKKIVKNRMHIDVVGDTEELVGLGATVLRRKGDDIDWDLLADPEGNEFCVFAPR